MINAMFVKTPQSDPRSYDIDRSNQPQVSSPWDALEYSRRARLTAAGTIIAETVEINPAPVDSRELGLSQVAITKAGNLAVRSMDGFAGGVQDTAQELFGAKPSSTINRPVRLPDLRNAELLMAA